jgi:endogenous inhibitor of DNA gyrase (YacG/DUF329 family)
MSEPSLSARKCPSCGKPVVERFRPFCSKRCADIDLGRWLKGSYAIPAVEDDAGVSETVGGGGWGGGGGAPRRPRDVVKFSGTGL